MGLNTTGSQNVAVGMNALTANTGAGNTALGLGPSIATRHPTTIQLSEVLHYTIIPAALLTVL